MSQPCFGALSLEVVTSAAIWTGWEEKKRKNTLELWCFKNNEVNVFCVLRACNIRRYC